MKEGNNIFRHILIRLWKRRTTKDLSVENCAWRQGVCRCLLEIGAAISTPKKVYFGAGKL